MTIFETEVERDAATIMDTMGQEVTVILTEQHNRPVTITGIFTDGYHEADVSLGPMTTGVTTRKLTLDILNSQFEAVTNRQPLASDRIIIGTTPYTVNDVQPDGFSMTKLILFRAQS